ncbi:MAG: TylF/MycF/NovP-related O-methyltransferase [Patescibacteria group bacterium]
MKVSRIRDESIPDPIRPWDTSPDFGLLYGKIQAYTLVDQRRCFMLYQFVHYAISLDGEIAEIGVYNGGTAKLISNILKRTQKKLYIFDTFSGMPKTDEQKDLHHEGDFKDTSFAAVSEYLKDTHNVVVTQGFFPESGNIISNTLFSLVHIDVDIYRSVLDVASFFYTRMTRGGIMIFDDYGFISCPGAKQAVDEFFASRLETPIYLPTGQCLVIKL